MCEENIVLDVPNVYYVLFLERSRIKRIIFWISGFWRKMPEKKDNRLMLTPSILRSSKLTFENLTINLRMQISRAKMLFYF